MSFARYTEPIRATEPNYCRKRTGPPTSRRLRDIVPIIRACELAHRRTHGQSCTRASKTGKMPVKIRTKEYGNIRLRALKNRARNVRGTKITRRLRNRFVKFGFYCVWFLRVKPLRGNDWTRQHRLVHPTQRDVQILRTRSRTKPREDAASVYFNYHIEKKKKTVFPNSYRTILTADDDGVCFDDFHTMPAKYKSPETKKSFVKFVRTR